MNSHYIKILGGAHARAYVRGLMSLLEIQNWIQNVADDAKPANRAAAAALYVLTLASHLPDTAELDLRKHLVSYLDR